MPRKQVPTKQPASVCKMRRSVRIAEKQDNPGPPKQGISGQGQDKHTKKHMSESQEDKQDILINQNDPEEMSEYDKIRQINIEERKKKFQELGLNEAKKMLSESLTKKISNNSSNKRLGAGKVQSKEQDKGNKSQQVPPRRSMRIQEKKQGISGQRQFVKDPQLCPFNSGPLGPLHKSQGWCTYCRPSQEDSKPSQEDSKPSQEDSKHSQEDSKPSKEESKPSASPNLRPWPVLSPNSALSKRSEEDLRPFTCPYCDKKFVSNGKLRRHRREVHVRQKYQCSQCIASFTRKYRLKNHMKLGKHKKSKPSYECSICSVKFRRKQALDRHINEVHSKIGQIKCPECEKVFTRVENMKSHMRRFHSDQPQLYKCDICNKMFTHTGTLKRHKAQIHERFRYECSECSAEFSRKVGLDKHVESGKHYVDFYCDSCKQKLVFRSMKMLKKHVKVRNAYPDGFELRCSGIPRQSYHFYMRGGVKKEEKEKFIREGLRKARVNN